MIVLKMAWRNVWRNYRRSLVTIAAMTLALFVELLYAGLVTGLVYGMEEDATAYELGDVQIFAKDYPTRPSIYEKVDDPDALLQKLDAGGFPATARLFGGGLAASGELSSGASFVGIDPVRDAATMDLHTAVAEGRWLDDADPRGVVVGRGLARVLDLELGDEVLVLSQAADGSVANDLFEVRGILFSVAAGLDRGGILMTESTFRELMVFPSGAHRIYVRKPREMGLAEAGEAVKALVGTPEGTPIDVMTWKEVQPMLAQYIDSVAGVVVVLYFIVYLAVGILILNAMLMAVFERIREFGVLKAIGYGPFQVFSMMVAEGLLQAVVATVIGVVLAAPAMYYLQVVGIDVGTLGGMQMAGLTMPAVWNAYYTVQTTQVPVFMLFFIVFFAVLYPAVKAAWISPVEAMHHQ
ncbi:MAG: FtsX-like permease family protein [Myxococcota bacterium]